MFVMIGLYAGLRREEILALKWDCVFLDTETPYLLVRRAWHTERNRPVIMTELKTKAAKRDIPIPYCLAECLREAKEHFSTKDYTCVKLLLTKRGRPVAILESNDTKNWHWRVQYGFSTVVFKMLIQIGLGNC